MQEIRYQIQSAQWLPMPRNEKDPLREALVAFGGNLQTLLDIHKMSQADLGRALSKGNDTVSTKTINNIVNARHPPELDNLSKIAGHFKVPLWPLLVPGLKTELLENGALGRMVKLMADYVTCSDTEREYIEKMAAGYAGLHRDKE